MGRLIDADVLIAQIWEKQKKVEESYDLCVDELKEVFCGIVALVDEQPTAYDPDKVVEQLEEFQGELDLFGCSSILPDMIDVVARGGVDGN